MSSPNPRKRPASGAPPMVPIPQMQQPFTPVQADQMFRWNGGVDGNGFVDPGSPAVNSFAMMPTPGAYGQPSPAPSTALARRQNSRALVPSGARSSFDHGTDNWAGFTDEPAYLQAANASMDEHDNIDRLEEMAQRAKREAQAKRKQIPPFVQKLSSFLDESRNTDLIRWSDKGDSFIVLDEDEFAKTLIPELFKHNNYASFVRQLNMYGFHKRVGLSDNSMKASERKNKSPSEYYNPYFRRGHPNLLWLINKPKSGNSKKKGKKEDAEGESDEDAAAEEAYSGQNLTSAHVGRGPVSNELGPLQKKDLIQVKSQIERLQQQQVAISNMLTKMRQDQNQLYQQAVMFQNMHERHENSINAILNFLANVFRKSLEEQGGVQSVQDLLASIIPNSQGHGQPQMSPGGGVVDLGGFVNQRPQNITSAVGTPKRQQRLLPPIPHQQANKAALMSPSTTPSPPVPPVPQVTHQGPQMGTVTELFDVSPNDTTSPAYMKNELQSNPQEGMMKIIHDTNAVSNSGIDLTDMAAKTSASMSDDQRSKMLSIMAGGTTSPTLPGSGVSNAIPVTSPATSLPAVATPALPVSGPSLSPILSTIPIMPPLHELQATQAQLEALQRLQSEQATQIDQLTSLLGPLSPSGRIPGLDEHGNPNTSYFDNVDYDQFINANAFSDPNYDAAGFDGIGIHNAGDATGDFNFSLDGNTATTTATADFIPGGASGAAASANGVNNSDGSSSSSGGNNVAPGFETGRVLETTSAANSPSTAGTEDVTPSELFDTNSPDHRGTKRRRKG
ncbi:Heat shock transcription factor [Madurella fahalii]|uniref:Heat shock transcription factor n=1 Tax=Madurella fahalii TaxID=1157608 RepID=A0ABQ0G6H0_9PEZI